MNADQGYTDQDVPRLDGQRIVITGANAGLGFEMARVLLEKGAEIVLACRDQKRGDAAVEKLRIGPGGERATLSLLDLGDLKSIRSFAERELAESRPLHGLTCNAGLMAIPERKTADGFEMTMGVNHLGHFALVGLLLGKLASAPSHGPRVVTVSSHYHRAGSLELMDDLFLERRGYHRWIAYQQSKLANLLFTFELARRLAKAGSPIKSLAAHPGYAATELQGKGAQMGAPKWEGFMMGIGNAMFAQSVRAGSWPQQRAATDPDAKNGDYFGPKHLGQLRGPAVRVEPHEKARDESAAKRLWERSEELTRVAFAV